VEDFPSFFITFQDYLAPRLDVYEQAIYLYIARHTVAVNSREVVIGFKSARKKMAFGVGTAGSAPSEATIYEKLKSLQTKGAIRILSSERTGTRVSIVIPAEIPGLVPAPRMAEVLDIEAVDFFLVPENRRLIFEREEGKCFYCLAALDENTHVIEHVVSRPAGANTYRNVVSACRQCNNRKNSTAAEDYLRMLYREGLLSMDDLTGRQAQLERLKNGELRPKWPSDG
jgi:hypothetical protein